jgi:hypothetical protein
MNSQFHVAAKVSGETGVYDSFSKRIAWFPSLKDTHSALGCLKRGNIQFEKLKSEAVHRDTIIINADNFAE